MRSPLLHKLLVALAALAIAAAPAAGAAAPAPPDAPPAALRFLALGDSYTIGEGVDARARWPVVLADSLRAHGRAIAEPEIIARTGWTTDELDAAIDRAHPQGDCVLVSLMIGVNNQYRGRPVETYRKQFRALLSRAVRFANRRPAHVLVLSIPDWGVTPFAAGRNRGAIAAEIDRFNKVVAEETARAHAVFVDITPLSRTAAADSTQFAADGLHPSERQLASWAALALPSALVALAD